MTYKIKVVSDYQVTEEIIVEDESLEEAKELALQWLEDGAPTRTLSHELLDRWIENVEEEI